jgi:hypothetical protein
MTSIKRLTWCAFSAVILTTGASAWGQIINFTAGGGDIHFLYESQLDRWQTVFRAKGTAGQPTTTTATGLTSPFAGFTGTATGAVMTPAVAGDTGDYEFGQLRVNLATTQTLSVDGTPFYYLSANGHFANPDGAPDLGIRIRLREDEVALGNPLGNTDADQFDNFVFAINTSLSTYNGNPLASSGAFVSLFADVLGTPDALINTATGNDDSTFNTVWTHQHRNWGFSEYGQYNLVLDIGGVDGTYGPKQAQAEVTFNVIPEPSTLGLVLLGLGFGGLLRKQRLHRAR